MSDCGCVYSSDDGNLATFSTQKVVRAKKAHKCGECGDLIAVGAAYESVSGLWDGELLTCKTCLTCVEIRGQLFCEGWTYGTVWADIDAYFQEGGNPMGCIKNLETAAAKEKLAEAYREFLDLPKAAPEGGEK